MYQLKYISVKLNLITREKKVYSIRCLLFCIITIGKEAKFCKEIEKSCNPKILRCVIM